MTAAYGVVALGAVLLVVAGTAKVAVPRPAAAALGALGVHVADAAVRAGAALEVAVGVAALLTAAPWACAAVAASYAVLAVFLLAATRSGRVADCGCFGAQGRPPRVRQVVLDALVAVGAALAVPAHADSAASQVAAHPVTGVAFVLVTLAGALLAYHVHESPLEGMAVR